LVSHQISNVLPVPVPRAADYAKKGKGSLYISTDDLCLIRGEGTAFKTQLATKMKITLPKSLGYASGEVEQVLSDVELRLKSPFKAEKGESSQLDEKLAEHGMKGIEGWKALPHFDQTMTFKNVYKALKDGGAIGIFPEGAVKPASLTHHVTHFFSFKVAATTAPTSSLSNPV
jgi:glycerol-3-phosphate O-acyltransferase/dihydroxyacetone phosphate acyltransferase